MGSDNFDSVKVNDGVIISTRKLADGVVDHDAGLSGGNSGNIYIASPDITIGAGTKLLANAINDGTAYTAGDVKLEALLNAGSSLLDVVYISDHPKTNITIGSNAVIKGKDIILTAKSDCRQEYNPPVPPDGAPDPSASWLDTGAGELKTIIDGLPDKVTGALKGVSIVAGVTISRATSMVSLNADSLIEGQSFEALSASYVNAATKPTAIGAGVAVAIGAADAQVILKGKIVTAGNCNVNSLADNTVKVVGSSTGIKGLSAGVAVSILSSKSNVEADSTANFQVGGNLKLEAKTIDRNYTLASSALEEDGKVGIAVAVSNEDGDTTAYLGGIADVAGDINVNALMSKDVFTDTSFFGLIPSVKSGVNAVAGVNTNPNATVATEAQKAIMEKIKGPLMDKIKGMIKSKSNTTQTKTDKVSPFEVAAAIAIYTDTNKATAGIADSATVKSRGNILVNAKAESQPSLLSTGSTVKPKDPPAGNADGVKFEGSAAVAIGDFINDVTAYIGKSAKVDTANDLTVKAEFINDYKFRYGVELIDTLTKEYSNSTEASVNVAKDDIVEVKDGHSAGGEAGNLYKYLKDAGLTDIDLSTINFADTDSWEDLGSNWKFRSTELITKLANYLDKNMNANSAANFWI